MDTMIEQKIEVLKICRFIAGRAPSCLTGVDRNIIAEKGKLLEKYQQLTRTNDRDAHSAYNALKSSLEGTNSRAWTRLRAIADAYRTLYHAQGR